MTVEANPKKYEKGLMLKVSVEEHRNIKELAERERRSIKGLIFCALDKAFPRWNDKK
jgi:predicted HicB family RNase H-like nuclease